MSGIFLDQRAMGEIRWSEGVANSVMKRNKIKGYADATKCGCSRSCGFCRIREYTPAPVVEKKPQPTNKGAKKKYIEWLKHHAK